MRSTLFALLLLFANCVAASDGPRGFVDHPSHDFGTVEQGLVLTHVFLLRNVGTTPLEIRRAEIDLPGVKVAFKPSIPPGQEGNVRVIWDTSRVKGRIDGTVSLALNDSAQPSYRLSIAAKVEPPVELSPLGAFFISLFGGEAAEREITILNHRAEPLFFEQPVYSESRFSVLLTPLDSGKKYSLKVRVASNLPAGRYDEQIELIPKVVGVSPLRIPVHLLVKNDLYVNPEKVEFGPIAMDAIKQQPDRLSLLTQTFLLKKRADRPFHLRSIETDAVGVQIRTEPAVGTSSATYRVDVSLDPKQLRSGKLAGAIIIRTDDPKFPELRVPVLGELF